MTAADSTSGLLNGSRASPGLARRLSTAVEIRHGSLRGAVLTLTFSAVGSGILGLPWAISALGGGLGLVTLLVSALLSFAALRMLLAVRDASGATAYAAAVDSVLSPLFGRLLACFLIIGSFGSICASMLYATDFLVDTVALSNPELAARSSTRSVAVLMLGVAILFLVWPRDVTRWRSLSALCVPVILYVSAVLIAEASRGSDVSGRCQRDKSDGFRFVAADLAPKSLTQAFCVFLYSFCCHFNLFPVAETLSNPSPNRIFALAALTVGLQSVLYIAIALAGYFTWFQALLRSSDSGNVLNCYAVSDIPVAVGRILMVFTLLISTTLNFHPVRENALRLVFSAVRSSAARRRWLIQPAADDPFGHASPPGFSPSCSIPEMMDVFTVAHTATWLYAVATVVLLGLAIFITFVVTSVLDILAFIGGLAAVSLMFVFPGLIYARAVGRTRMFAVSAPCFGIATVIGVISVVFSVEDMVSKKR
jgi:amino acid permease